MRESELLEEIRKLCDDFGLLAFHVHDARRSWGSGYPDLTIAGPEGILFRECKDRAAQATPGQRLWGQAINEAGGDWALWRPHDLLNGNIRRQLTRIAGLTKDAA
jgi:hypothetical protein